MYVCMYVCMYVYIYIYIYVYIYIYIVSVFSVVLFRFLVFKQTHALHDLLYLFVCFTCAGAPAAARLVRRRVLCLLDGVQLLI